MTAAHIITKQEYCQFCVAAKNLFDIHSIEYTEQVLGVDYSKEQLLEDFETKGLPPPMTVPQIFLDDVYIGGHREFVAWLKNFKKEEAKNE